MSSRLILKSYGAIVPSDSVVTIGSVFRHSQNDVLSPEHTVDNIYYTSNTSLIFALRVSLDYSTALALQNSGIPVVMPGYHAAATDTDETADAEEDAENAVETLSAARIEFPYVDIDVEKIELSELRLPIDKHPAIQQRARENEKFGINFNKNTAKVLGAHLTLNSPMAHVGETNELEDDSDESGLGQAPTINNELMAAQRADHSQRVASARKLSDAYFEKYSKYFGADETLLEVGEALTIIQETERANNVPAGERFELSTALKQAIEEAFDKIDL